MLDSNTFSFFVAVLPAELQSVFIIFLKRCETAPDSVLSYLGDRQLQLDHILRLGHRGLEGRVQQQDAVEVFSASHRIVVHKQHLVHRGEVLAPDTAARFSCIDEKRPTRQTVRCVEEGRSEFTGGINIGESQRNLLLSMLT